MSIELIFGLVIVSIVLVAAAIVEVGRRRDRIGRVIRGWLQRMFDVVRRNTGHMEKRLDGSRADALSAEEDSKAELQRIQKVIDDRKQIARETDISHHLWGFYRGHFRQRDPLTLNRLHRGGEWYDVKILSARTGDGLNRFEFELKGDRYAFVDDEERQGWSDNAKRFSLFLYDGSERCIIEIPMKVKVHKSGRTYSISSDGPKAFLPGDWINDFINVKLKHQSMRNREIRAQKHQERLWEIEELKDRFGIYD